MAAAVMAVAPAAAAAAAAHLPGASVNADLKLAGQTQEVLARLKFIGKIRAHTKVDVGSLRLCETSLAGRAYRHFLTPSEGKATTYPFLDNTFNEAFELIARLQLVDELQGRLRELLLAAIDAALKGIQTLTKTYEGEDIFISRLQALVDVTSLKLNNLR